MRAAEISGRLAIQLESQVVRIDQTEVVIEQSGATRALPSDAVIACTGGVMPTEFLKEIGVHMETKYGTG